MRPLAQELAAIQSNYSAIGCGFRLSPQFRHPAFSPPSLDPVVAVDAIDDIGDRPGGDEHADDHIAEDAEIVAERADRAPEPAAVGEAQPIADQVQRLEAADDQRDDTDTAVMVRL